METGVDESETQFDGIVYESQPASPIRSTKSPQSAVIGAEEGSKPR